MGTVVRTLFYVLVAAAISAPVWFFGPNELGAPLSGLFIGSAIGLCISQYIAEEWWLDYEWVGAPGARSYLADLRISVPIALRDAKYILPVSAGVGVILGILLRAIAKVAGYDV
jgi:hypothetical protein